MVSILIGSALAQPPLCGEELKWSIHYLGIHAGDVWATTKALGEDGLEIEIKATSAQWYTSIYSVEDSLKSHWYISHSKYHKTQFREGRFWQDQEFFLDNDPIIIKRRQWIEGEWRSHENEYSRPFPIEDPISVLYRLRYQLPLESAEYKVFTGKEFSTLHVKAIDRQIEKHDILGKIETQKYQLFSSHQGVVEQKGDMTMSLTTDSNRVPLFATIRSNIGTIHAELQQVKYIACSP